MRRPAASTRAFTLVEVLVATVLCTAVVITAATWSGALERRATALQADGGAIRTLVQAAAVLRQDLLLAPTLPGSAQLGAPLTVHTLAHDPGHLGLHPVTWRLTAGSLVRTVAAGDFTPEQAVTIATHLDHAALVTGDDGRLRLHLSSGTHVLDLAILPATGSHGP